MSAAAASDLSMRIASEFFLDPSGSMCETSAGKSMSSVRKLCSGCQGLPSTFRLPIGARAQAYRTETGRG